MSTNRNQFQRFWFNNFFENSYDTSNAIGFSWIAYQSIRKIILFHLMQRKKLLEKYLKIQIHNWITELKNFIWICTVIFRFANENIFCWQNNKKKWQAEFLFSNSKHFETWTLNWIQFVPNQCWMFRAKQRENTTKRMKNEVSMQ